jgi:hypothetical protein
LIANTGPAIAITASSGTEQATSTTSGAAVVAGAGAAVVAVAAVSVSAATATVVAVAAEPSLTLLPPSEPQAPATMLIARPRAKKRRRLRRIITLPNEVLLYRTNINVDLG